jgi:hypothetical protein
MGVLKMRKYILQIIVLIGFNFYSCGFDDQEAVYQENLVVFGSIVANLPVSDTVLVSRSASISEDVLAQDLWIDDADVYMINDSTKDSLMFKNVGTGKYFPINDQSNSQEILNYFNFVIIPGQTYHLVVNHEIGSVIATTTVPNEMTLTPSDMGDYECPDGTILPTSMIDVNNLESLSDSLLVNLYQNPSSLNSLILENGINVDTVTYRFGECFTQSFASYPMFAVDFDADGKTIKILSNALESQRKGLEPLDSLGKALSDSGNYIDYNRNQVRDSTFVNLIYDTTLGFRIWKGQYPRDEDSNPYRVNPWQWNVERSPTPIMWLYFDYYGLHTMTFLSTSESYFNYYSGDPVGQNIYLLPESNVEGGLGVLYSSFSSSFLVYVKRDDE